MNCYSSYTFDVKGGQLQVGLRAGKASAADLCCRGSSPATRPIGSNWSNNIEDIYGNAELVLRLDGKVIMQAPEVLEQDEVISIIES